MKRVVLKYSKPGCPSIISTSLMSFNNASWFKISQYFFHLMCPILLEVLLLIWSVSDYPPTTLSTTFFVDQQKILLMSVFPPVTYSALIILILEDHYILGSILIWTSWHVIIKGGEARRWPFQRKIWDFILTIFCNDKIYLYELLREKKNRLFFPVLRQVRIISCFTWLAV